MKTASPLLDKVHCFLDSFDVQSGLVVAVSGGPDSVALLRAVLAVPPPISPRRLVIAHLNHRLRGEESEADAAFVEGLFNALKPCAPRALRWRSARIDVAAQACAEGDNLESVARRLRYTWLADVARDEGVLLVATGHTADDQAETVLHRMLRGTGLRGLRGIAPRRELAPDISVIRPLLNVTRAQVLAYLEAQGQPYREDRSNRDTRYTRNRIRHELLPYLSKNYNPVVASVLAHLAQGADEIFQWYEAAARTLLAEVEYPRAGSLIVLDRNQLAAAPAHLAREVLRLIWSREEWPVGGMDFDAWDRLAGLVGGAIPALDLPGGVRAQIKGRVVQIGRAT